MKAPTLIIYLLPTVYRKKKKRFALSAKPLPLDPKDATMGTNGYPASLCLVVSWFSLVTYYTGEILWMDEIHATHHLRNPGMI